MILYVVRHGIATNPANPASPADEERPLTRKGIDKTRNAMLGLRELGVKPDAIVTSPLVRAAQTAEIACETLAFPREKIRRTDSLKPGANPEEFFKELSRMRSKEAMCFGHAPQLDQLISYALGARNDVTTLKKAGVACLEIKGFSPPKVQLQWLFPPKVLRKLRK